MRCPTCLDIELCDDCEMNLCPLCCPIETCSLNFAYHARSEEVSTTEEVRRKEP